MYHGTPQRDAAALERQLRLVRLAFPVVSLGDLTACRRNGRARVALTFDDGLRNNVHVAYPILQKLGLSATFFVCPGLIERQEWLWNHQARQRLLALPTNALGEIAANVGAPARGVEAIVEWIKTLRLAARRQGGQPNPEATPRLAPSPAAREEFDLVRWD